MQSAADNACGPRVVVVRAHATYFRVQWELIAALLETQRRVCASSVGISHVSVSFEYDSMHENNSSLRLALKLNSKRGDRPNTT